MRGQLSESQNELCVDVDIQYDLDMSKFPGLDETREPTLLIQTPDVFERILDIVEKEYGESERSAADDDDDDDDVGCAFCDALNVAEENDNVTVLSEPCYIRGVSPNRLFYFQDSDILECETVEIMEEEATKDENDYMCTDDAYDIIGDLSEAKTYWVNSADSDSPACVAEVEYHTTGSDLQIPADGAIFTQLTASQYIFDEPFSHNSSTWSTSSLDPSLEEQLPLFIDLVDQLSPVLSPSGRVWSRKGSNCDKDNDRQFLASSESLRTIGTSHAMKSVSDSHDSTIFPRGS